MEKSEQEQQEAVWAAVIEQMKTHERRAALEQVQATEAAVKETTALANAERLTLIEEMKRVCNHRGH